MFYFTNKKRPYASRYIILVSFCYRKIFPFCVGQIKKINFLYFSSLNGLGDQIRIFSKSFCSSSLKKIKASFYFSLASSSS